MREILFRGKRKDTGEWTEGYFFKSWDRTFLLWGMIDDIPDMIEVIPETVGQFTGLTDKNGKKIFEGDIVKEWSSHWKTPLKTEINIYEVVCEYLGSLHLIRKTEYGENSTPLYRRSVVEVIGNIYDSPKFLEELEKYENT